MLEWIKDKDYYRKKYNTLENKYKNDRDGWVISNMSLGKKITELTLQNEQLKKKNANLGKRNAEKTKRIKELEEIINKKKN